MNNLPIYPIYIPSKNRADACYTARYFQKDGVRFHIVVEPAQVESYERAGWGKYLLILPEDNLRLLGSRLWIRQHSIDAGFARHWQFDDNITHLGRLHRGLRIRCNANRAISVVEEFTDRYTNIGVSGFNYQMFVKNTERKPYVLNCKVYSGSLINNQMPHKWRLYYNDDTDLCLQVVTNQMCTVSFNAFYINKLQTMTVKGGNTDDLYQKEGRLIMARTLEEVWPDYVTTKWRFGRPQHVVKNSWKDFKTPLIRRTDLDWNAIRKKTYDFSLTKVSDIKNKELSDFYQQYNTKP